MERHIKLYSKSRAMVVKPFLMMSFQVVLGARAPLSLLMWTEGGMGMVVGMKDMNELEESSCLQICRFGEACTVDASMDSLGGK